MVTIIVKIVKIVIIMNMTVIIILKIKTIIIIIEIANAEGHALLFFPTTNYTANMCQASV